MQIALSSSAYQLMLRLCCDQSSSKPSFKGARNLYCTQSHALRRNCLPARALFDFVVLHLVRKQETCCIQQHNTSFSYPGTPRSIGSDPLWNSGLASVRASRLCFYDSRFRNWQHLTYAIDNQANDHVMVLDG